MFIPTGTMIARKKKRKKRYSTGKKAYSEETLSRAREIQHQKNKAITIIYVSEQREGEKEREI